MTNRRSDILNRFNQLEVYSNTYDKNMVEMPSIKERIKALKMEPAKVRDNLKEQTTLSHNETFSKKKSSLAHLINTSKSEESLQRNDDTICHKISSPPTKMGQTSNISNIQTVPQSTQSASKHKSSVALFIKGFEERNSKVASSKKFHSPVLKLAATEEGKQDVENRFEGEKKHSKNRSSTSSHQIQKESNIIPNSSNSGFNNETSPNRVNASKSQTNIHPRKVLKENSHLVNNGVENNTICDNSLHLTDDYNRIIDKATTKVLNDNASISTEKTEISSDHDNNCYSVDDSKLSSEYQYNHNTTETIKDRSDIQVEDFNHLISDQLYGDVKKPFFQNEMLDDSLPSLKEEDSAQTNEEVIKQQAFEGESLSPKIKDRVNMIDRIKKNRRKRSQKSFCQDEEPSISQSVSQANPSTDSMEESEHRSAFKNSLKSFKEDTTKAQHDTQEVDLNIKLPSVNHDDSISEAISSTSSLSLSLKAKQLLADRRRGTIKRKNEPIDKNATKITKSIVSKMSLSLQNNYIRTESDIAHRITSGESRQNQKMVTRSFADRYNAHRQNDRYSASTAEEDSYDPHAQLCRSLVDIPHDEEDYDRSFNTMLNVDEGFGNASHNCSYLSGVNGPILRNLFYESNEINPLDASYESLKRHDSSFFSFMENATSNVDLEEIIDIVFGCDGRGHASKKTSKDYDELILGAEDTGIEMEYINSREFEDSVCDHPLDESSSTFLKVGNKNVVKVCTEV